MKVIEAENVIMCDVDDTLVMWDANYTSPVSNSISMPEHKEMIVDPYDKSVVWLRPHQRHIDLLKKYKGRGMTVIVWSAAGYKWAEAVVKVLGLEPFVDYIMTKPSKYIDDLPANEVLGTRIYLKEIV